MKPRDIAIEFAANVKNQDFISLKSILEKSGEFEAEPTPNGESEIYSRDAYLEWLQSKCQSTQIRKIDYDQCLFCQIGNPVVLFNDGRFPKKMTEDANRSKAGLMLDIKRNKIASIKFCYTFLKTENKFLYECKGPIIKDLMDKGYTLKQAIKKAGELFQ
jgi:hypothetical protein